MRSVPLTRDGYALTSNGGYLRIFEEAKRPLTALSGSGQHETQLHTALPLMLGRPSGTLVHVSRVQVTHFG